VFDTVDEASYIPDVSAYLKLLETRVWPLLGISPTVHNTGGWLPAGMPQLARVSTLADLSLLHLKNRHWAPTC
jgi:hypothetical protein